MVFWILFVSLTRYYNARLAHWRTRDSNASQQGADADLNLSTSLDHDEEMEQWLPAVDADNGNFPFQNS